MGGGGGVALPATAAAAAAVAEDMGCFGACGRYCRRCAAAVLLRARALWQKATDGGKGGAGGGDVE